MFNKINICLIFLLLLFSIENGSAQKKYQVEDRKNRSISVFPTQKQWNTISNHPRLFIEKNLFEKIKFQNDSITIRLKSILKIEADKIVKSEPLVYPNGINTMDTGRDIQGQLVNLAMAYRLFGDLCYLERAKKEVLRTTELQNWGTGHFLDAAEISLGVGIAFDWLYDHFTIEERKKVAKAIAEKILLPSLEAKEGVTHATSWVNGNFNWNPVCHTGISVGALSIAEIFPKLSKQVVERAITNLPFAGESYANDGSFPEAPSYWSYGTSFFAMEIEALRSVFGHASNLEKTPGFLKSADYILQMTGPTGQDFNYSDYHADRWNEPIMMWYGRELKRRILVNNEIDAIKSINLDLLNEKQTNLHRLTTMELIWWKPNLLSQKVELLPLHYSANGGLSIGVMRTSWNDPLAGFLAIKGGTPNVSHGHMDASSFVYEANGIRWALDLGTEDYNKMRAAKLDLWNYSQNSTRWDSFRAGPESHNIIRFDNAKQDVSGVAPISQLSKKSGVVGNVLDLTTLYSSQVEKVTRTVRLFPNKSIAIEDEWKTTDKDVEYVFQWITAAKASIAEYGVLLEQNGQSIKLKIETQNSQIKPEIVIEDVSKSKAIQDSDNPGVSRILIKLKSRKSTSYKLIIKAIPE
jgi:oligo-alginate lyase